MRRHPSYSIFNRRIPDPKEPMPWDEDGDKPEDPPEICDDLYDPYDKER